MTPQQALEADPALTIIASAASRASSRRTRSTAAGRARGEFRVNPLYVPSRPGGRRGSAPMPASVPPAVPVDDYEQEYGACRQYLPDEVTIARDALDGARTGRARAGELADLIRRRVIVDLPQRYY